MYPKPSPAATVPGSLLIDAERGDMESKMAGGDARVDAAIAALSEVDRPVAGVPCISAGFGTASESSRKLPVGASSFEPDRR